MSKDCAIAVYNSSSLNKQHVSYGCIHTCMYIHYTTVLFVYTIVYYIVCLMPHSIAQTLKVYITPIPIVSIIIIIVPIKILVSSI